MSWLYEQTWPTIAISGCIAALAITLFFQSRRPAYLLGILAAGGVLALGLWIEAAVVTENEEIEESLNAVAEAIEAGDLDTVLSYIAPESYQLRAEARLFSLQQSISSVKVTVQRVDITRSSSPIRARVRISGTVKGKDVASNNPKRTPDKLREEFVYMGRLELWMYKEGDRWLIERHEKFRE